jgi:hypothetical protein
MLLRGGPKWTLPALIGAVALLVKRKAMKTSGTS